jgi:hypothetical protein
MNANNLELIDIYDVWYNPWWHSLWFIVLCCIIACTVIILMVYSFYKFWWPKRKISFEKQALSDLANLANKPTETQEQIRASYFQVTLILKNYLQKRYVLNLTDKTDLEIALMLEGLVSPQLYHLIKEFLQRSFQIKFAHETVLVQTLQDDIKLVQKVIETTHKDFGAVGNS